MPEGLGGTEPAAGLIVAESPLPESTKFFEESVDLRPSSSSSTYRHQKDRL